MRLLKSLRDLAWSSRVFSVAPKLDTESFTGPVETMVEMSSSNLVVTSSSTCFLRHFTAYRVGRANV